MMVVKQVAQARSSSPREARRPKQGRKEMDDQTWGQEAQILR
jgi:hypothetical protein